MHLSKVILVLCLVKINILTITFKHFLSSNLFSFLIGHHENLCNMFEFCEIIYSVILNSMQFYMKHSSNSLVVESIHESDQLLIF